MIKSKNHKLKKNLFFQFTYLFYQVIRRSIRAMQRNSSPSFACKLQNIFLMLHMSTLRVSYDKSNNLFFAHDGKFIWYFSEMSRGFDFYAGGLMQRGQRLSNSYCLEKIQFNKSDIVIDCGANFADLYISLSKKINEFNYITFEPSPREFSCIQKNVPNAKNYNFALSNKIGKVPLYISSATGDSSLIEPRFFTGVTIVNVTTLDQFFLENSIKQCKLIKIEAEGLEPEILEGAQNSLSKCEYVALDGGRERGVNSDLTLHICNNFLLKSGFEMVDINGKVYRALYRNTTFLN
jgi:FkbM family methyltransferase